MLEKIINKFKNLDNNVKKIMVNGFKFSFLFCCFSSFILLMYSFFPFPVLYKVGTILFKTSLMFFVDFIIIGVGFDTIKKQTA